MAEQMREAFRDETPQEAAERIWKETKHDPVETMRLFDEWAREEPERMLAMLGPNWGRAVRAFLERNNQHSRAWKYGDAFRRKIKRWENKRLNSKPSAVARRSMWTSDPDFRGAKNAHMRLARDRIKRGIKVVRAEVDTATGNVVNLIDKEYGPFAHIRINGLRLPEITTEEALAHCDKKIADVRFIRALCHLIPDPRKPIGDQWTPEIIREAKKAAELRNE